VPNYTITIFRTVVVSVNSVTKLYCAFRAHVKIASRIVLSRRVLVSDGVNGASFMSLKLHILRCKFVYIFCLHSA